ncbi:MAG: beta-galactosidase [Opitutales bacterium]|nr:beta-galactosidase [Opitutales bacterium]
MKNALLKIVLIGSLMIGLAACQSAQNQKSYTAEVNENGVFVGGKPFRILSGEIHYFRVQPAQWRDRLEKLRACGLNCVSVYVPWNLHNPQPDEFNFEGIANVGGFLDICDEMGIKVLLRPAPYICSEWDFGGLPAWLLKDKNISIRSYDEKYIGAIKTYYKRLFKEISPYYCNNGGPIIAIQLENEYSSYGDDAKYIRFLKQEMLDSGFKGILYMAEGSPIYSFMPLDIEGVWTTATTFPILKTEDALKKLNRGKPLMISELWCGQGYRLGTPLDIIRKQDLPNTLAELDSFLARGGHVNLYMFHGGKTYGFFNGALYGTPQRPYTPFVSSYDADTLVNEAGDLTEKYYAYQKIFLKYNPGAKKYSVPPAAEKKSYGEVVFAKSAKLSDNFGRMAAKTVKSQQILSMEDMGYYYGMINYKATIPPQFRSEKITISKIRDRAWVYFNGKFVGMYTCDDPEPSFAIPQEGGELRILVENMGRVNAGAPMSDGRKGIEKVLIRTKRHFGWEISSIPFEDLSALNWKPASDSDKNCRHTFFKGEFTADEVADTYINFDNFTRGYVWVNGVNLGRYDCLPPVYTTYIPKELLKKGKNKIEIFELEGAKSLSAKFSKYPIYQRKDKRVIMK